MKEDFLQYVWRYKMYSSTLLFTNQEEQIKIKKVGIQNNNSGPDFLEAQVLIGTIMWVGQVEIHLKSSDWYVHHHEQDSNYDNVILHVVWEYDVEVFDKNNKPIPTLELKKYVDKKLIASYNNLLNGKANWILCEKDISITNSFVMKNWLERLFVERLEKKSNEINNLLKIEKNNYEAVMFQLLSKYFGLKVNGEAFLKLAQSFPFTLVTKLQNNTLQLESLFLGQAGFLDDDIEEVYHQQLKKEYKYLRHKHQLKPIDKKQFHFFRMRPANFPTIRIAQLIALYQCHVKVFSKLMDFNTMLSFYDFFNQTPNEFWETHYTFEKRTKKRVKKISKSFVDLILINVVIPLKFTYLKNMGVLNETDLFDLIQEIAHEKNTIIDKFIDLKIDVKNALDSQALLELKKEYCDKKRCMHCQVGNYLLKNDVTC